MNSYRFNFSVSVTIAHWVFYKQTFIMADFILISPLLAFCLNFSWGRILNLFVFTLFYRFPGHSSSFVTVEFKYTLSILNKISMYMWRI